MKEFLEVIGKTALVSLGGVYVEVKILDVKMSYGRTRYQITPLAGKGEVWVEHLKNIK